MQFVDLHCDTLTALIARPECGTLCQNTLGVDFARLDSYEGMLQVFAVFYDAGAQPPETDLYERVCDARDYFVNGIAKQERVIHVTSAGQLEADSAAGRPMALLSLEDGMCLEGKHERLLALFARGFRLLTLTWNYENCMGYPNSANPEIMRRGLKPFGVDMVREMGRLGMVVDVSHLSDGGFWDVLQVATRPVVASHSNARAITPHPRNLTDEMIRALAEKGGVMGLNFCPLFLGKDDSASRIDDMALHVAHIYQTGGAGVLALGSDLDGIGGNLEIADCAAFPLLEQALLRRGIPHSVLEQMWSGNALRVLRDALAE